MPIAAYPHRKRKVGSHFDEAGAEFFVIKVEVVMPDAGHLPSEAKINLPALPLR
jgi:hypothetical protein